MRQIIYIALILASCACYPVLQQPQDDSPKGWRYAEEFAQGDTTLIHRWWELFADSTLTYTIELAIQNNRELKSAFTNIERARNYIKIARAESLPSLYLDVEAEGYRINGTTVQEYTAAPALKWEISLFGAMQSRNRSAVSEYLATKWGYRSAILSLSGEVATTLFTLMQYTRSYTIAKRSYALRLKATALVDSMYRYGMSDGIALEQARSLVYSARSQIALYKRAVIETQLALNILLGRSPESEMLIEDMDVKIPDIPVGLPSQMLEHRADVQQSYHTMQSAAAKVGVARAARLPSISLTAEGGLLSYTLQDLSSAKPFGWSLTGVVAQPIFGFGALKRSEESARQEYMSAMYDYEQSTLQALGDVERAFVYISTYRTQLLALEALLVANTKIEETTSALYRSGMGDYLSVIDAQRELFSSQISYEESLAQQYINYVNLIKALGGGW